MSIPNPYEQIGVVIPTTTTTTCSTSYQSVTLQAGQSFVLPAGAKIVGVSDINLIQTDCAVIENPEELECYVISMIGAHQQDPNSIQAWDNDNGNTIVRSIIVQGVEYAINQVLLGDTGEFQTCGIVDFINSHPVLSNLLLCPDCAYNVDGTDGGVGELCFKTTPSVGLQTFVQVRTSLPIGSGVESIVNFIARPRSSYLPTGGVSYCDCDNC